MSSLKFCKKNQCRCLFFLLLCTLCATTSLLAQDLIKYSQKGVTPHYLNGETNALYETVEDARSIAPFESVNLLQFNEDHLTINYETYVKDAVFLDLQAANMQSFHGAVPTNLNFSVPVSTNKFFELELTLVNVRSSNYVSNIVGSSNFIPIDASAGTFYRGTVKGNPNSMAALNVFDNQIRLLISDDGGNYILGKLPSESGKYILYNDKNLLSEHDWTCSADILPQPPSLPQTNVEDVTNNVALTCVPTYYVVDEYTYNQFGQNTTAVNNWLMAITNEVAMLYQNAGILFEMSGSLIYDGTTPDPTANLNTTGEILSKVGETIQNNYTGRLVHWVSRRDLGGGVAWLDVLCSTYGGGPSHIGPYAVSAGLAPTVTPLPTYSWTVAVVAHEAGHNFGSPHTQSCSWNDANTAIDGCVNVEGGTCARPGTPTDGGTIMSYCHLDPNVGINLNKGWAKGADENSDSPNMGPYQRIRHRYANCDLAVNCGNSEGLVIGSTDAFKLEGNAGTTDFVFTVTRLGDLSGVVSAEYTWAGSGNNPADAADFVGGFITGTVKFAANVSTQTITINVNGDTAAEVDERFTVTLSNPTGIAIIIASSSGTIRDDDATCKLDPNETYSWEGVGIANFSNAEEAFYASLDFDAIGTPYVIFRDDTQGNKTTVMKFDGSNWSVVGTRGFSTYVIGNTQGDITISPTGDPWVILSTLTEESFGRLEVWRFDGTNWISFGPDILYPGGAPRLTFHNGIAYIAFVDQLEGASVMKYEGGSWQFVGPRTFTSEWGTVKALEFYNGEPYIAYKPWSREKGRGLSVWKFDGTNWGLVGTDRFGESLGEHPYNFDLKFDSKGVPYVCFNVDLEGSLNTGTNVMKYNGSTWESVGNAHFKNGSSLRMAIHNDIPYVAYRDFTDIGQRASVVYFEDNSWQYLGKSITEWLGGPSDLVFYDNTPHLLYSNWVFNQGLTTPNGASMLKLNKPILPDCPCDGNQMTLDDTPITAKTYKAAQTITSTGTVAANTTVNLQAGQSITLANNFTVESGGKFTAEIGECPVASSIASDPYIPTAKVAMEEDNTNSWSLVKIYPNPLQASTNIILNLPTASSVQLDLHDMSGRKIASIVNGNQLSAGFHQFQWQSDEVEAGMYFVVLNGQVTEKLVVLK